MTKIRVLKLGGSLLTRQEWPQRLRAWLRSQPIALNLLVIGGGEIVEAVRDLDSVHQFSPAFAHWLCIDLLSTTLQIASCLIPEMPVIANPEQLQSTLASAQTSTAPLTCLVHVNAFYGPSVTTPMLPEDWSTTSDSLAAWLAVQVNADELVLFKSVAPPEGATSVIELANLGIVDRAFVKLADHINATRIVNLSR